VSSKFMAWQTFRCDNPYQGLNDWFNTSRTRNKQGQRISKDRDRADSGW
jgi:hypothetical protein